MDEEFAGDELGERAAQLREHLKTCDACRERYDRLARVEAKLSGGGLSEQKMDALEARIFANLGKSTAPSAAPPPPVQRGWGTFLAAAAVVVLVAAFAIRGWLATKDDQFTPRGGGESWGVRAFCVKDGAVTAEALAGGTLPCAPGSLVQFTYTAPKAAKLSISLDGTDQTFFSGTQVVAGIDVAMSASTPVGEWLSGPQRVTARFTDDSGATLAESSLTITPK
jgi:hypothetical protein